MTLTMGNVTFDNYIAGTGTLIGNTTLTELILKVSISLAFPAFSLFPFSLVANPHTARSQHPPSPLYNRPIPRNHATSRKIQRRDATDRHRRAQRRVPWAEHPVVRVGFEAESVECGVGCWGGAEGCRC